MKGLEWLLGRLSDASEALWRILGDEFVRLILFDSWARGWRGLAEELMDMSVALAPEHGRATYGEPERLLTP